MKERASLLLFFQGHPEYEGKTTPSSEYRRDVGRYLNAQQAHLPDAAPGLPCPRGDPPPRGIPGRSAGAAQPALLERFASRPSRPRLTNSRGAAAVALTATGFRTSMPRAAQRARQNRYHWPKPMNDVAGKSLAGPAVRAAACWPSSARSPERPDAAVPLEGRLERSWAEARIKMAVNLMLAVEGRIRPEHPAAGHHAGVTSAR